MTQLGALEVGVQCFRVGDTQNSCFLPPLAHHLSLNWMVLSGLSLIH
ncbi:unnamed protein product [Rhodiola kirilowii]